MSSEPSRPASPLLGPSAPAAGLRRFVERAGSVDVPVLLEGETGTGKSHLARLIHGASGRAAGPYVAVNCAGIPDTLFESEIFGHRKGAFTGAAESRPGLFEQATGGTLVLDEVGELHPSQQAKLLTVLEDGTVRRLGGVRERRVDVRVVAATCRNLRRATREGEFRLDLFHRLALLRAHLAPLRERVEDVEPLALHFLARHGARHGIREPVLTPGALALLRHHTWPGNVRELSHVLEAALILARTPRLEEGHIHEVLGDADLGPVPVEGAWGPPAPPPPSGSRYSFFGTDEEEREIIRRALARRRGNRTRAARDLGMARNTLRSKMRKYGL